MPTIADEDGHVAAKLGVRELPTTLFLTSDHRVASMWEGPAGSAASMAGLAAARAALASRRAQHTSGHGACDRPLEAEPTVRPFPFALPQTPR
jgi:hypothetical protein